MIIRLVIGALGITIGLIISRLFDSHEIHKLKDQLIELEEDHNEVLNANSKLVAENAQLKLQIHHLIQAPPSPTNIPEFKD